MKIRTDFVTNSSSSSFICVTVNKVDGAKIEADVSLDTGYGSYFIEGDERDNRYFKEELDAVENGEQLLEVLETKISEYLENWLNNEGQESAGFYTKIKQIDSRQELKSISVKEEIQFDDGDNPARRTFSYNFETRQCSGKRTELEDY